MSPTFVQVWAAAHIAVLPSRREGLPKSLLEAAACGGRIVATDVPGCRAVARAGVNALLAPPDDAAALADAIERWRRMPRCAGASARRAAGWPRTSSRANASAARPSPSTIACSSVRSPQAPI